MVLTGERGGYGPATSELDPYRQLVVVDMSMTMTAKQCGRPSILLKINGELPARDRRLMA
jgi:hypothetical protein